MQPSRLILFLVLIPFFSFNQFSHAAQPKPVWQVEWEKTLEAAKKEGQVVVYISGYEAILPDFEKEFPEIKVIAVTGRGNQLGPRLLAERRAEKFIADVSSTGANPNFQQFHLAEALDPIKPALLLPEEIERQGAFLLGCFDGPIPLLLPSGFGLCGERHHCTAKQKDRREKRN